MATLMACADGDSTASSTWALCNATSELDSETGTTAVAASGTGTSANFTPGAITVDGVAVKLSHWTSLPTSGTVTVTLRQTGGTAADLASVTVAYSDLTYVGTTASTVNGWAFFKFASSVTLLAATTHAVKVANGTNQSLNLWRDATASNWSRQLRTTTTQAPAAGDKLLANREWTGSGTSTTRTVTEVQTLSSTGATLTGTGADNTGTGTLTWTNPTNIQAADGAYATLATTTSSGVSHYLRATNFGFAVPASSQILGVKVDVKWNSSVANTWKDTSVRLVKATVGGGSDRAFNAVLPTSDTVWTYGWNVTDTWGNTLTVSDVNNSGFGVELSLTHLTTTSSTASVDYVKLTVYYVQVPYGAVVVSDGGTYQFGTASGTDYAAVVNGAVAGATSGSRGLEVCAGGTGTLGTSGTRMPSTATGTLFFGVGTAVAFGTEARGSATQTGGVFRAYGDPKPTTWTRLTASAAANATVLTVGDTAGWAAGDEIAIGGSNRSTSETEYRTIASVDSATQLTILQPLTTAKEGGNNSNGDAVGVPVANLSRNVRVCGASSTLTTYVAVSAGATFDVDNTQVQYIGSITTNKQGIVTTTTASSTTVFTLRDSVVRDLAVTSGYLVNLQGSTTSGTVDGNVLYSAGNGNSALITAATSGVYAITDNCVIGKNRNVSGMSFSDVGSTVTGNLVTDCGSMFVLMEAGGVVGTFSNNTAIYGGTGLNPTLGLSGGTVSNCVFARNNASGFNPSGASLGVAADPALTLSNCTLFGNQNFQISLGTNCSGFRISSCVLYGEPSYATATGLASGAGCAIDVDNTTFAVHSSQDVQCFVSGSRIRLWNCLLASATELGGQTNMLHGSVVMSVNHDQVAGAMKVWKRYGMLSSDTSIYKTASPSLRLTPNTASLKLTSVNESSGIKAAVGSGGTATLTVYVRKSVVGDGAVYNGNQPRVMLRRNPALGVTDDTVLATASNAANGAWEQLTATTPAAAAAGVFEVYIDVDGTIGWANVDDLVWS